MNIFALDQEPVSCARYHHDKHVVKMILESAQLLSGAHHFFNQKATGSPSTDLELSGVKIYKATHINHPCAIWARSSSANYNWLWFLAISLCEEYTHRYNRTHKTEAVIDALSDVPNGIPCLALQPFVQCMPDEYKRPDSVAAYRAYYNGQKVEGNRWTSRTPPSWVQIKSST